MHASMKAVAAIVCAFFVALAPKLAQAADFTVTNSGFTYVFNGDTAHTDPTLTLIRGRTYTFDLSIPGHPFSIKTAPSSGTGDRFNNGVTGVGNGQTAGTLVFTVPSDAPSALFYACEAHAASLGMFGNIVVKSPVPAGNVVGYVALFLAMTVVGVIRLRRVRAVSG
jgi:hypothetical protein